MVRTWVRTILFAAIGLGMIPAAASAADGLAESSRALYWGYLTSKYNETMQFFEKKNLKAAMVSIEELKQLEDNLLGMVYNAQEKSEKISEALGDSWGETLESVDELVRVTGTVKNQIGHGALPLDQLQAAYDALGIDLEKSYTEMTKFGTGYRELLGWAQQVVDLWDKEVEPNYPKTMELLRAENYADGEEYLSDLKISTSSVFEYSDKNRKLASGLQSPRLMAQWSDTMVDSAQKLTNEVGAFQLKLWEQELFFDDIEKYYEATFEYLEDAYAETRVIGDEYSVLCKDGCK